MFFGDRLVIPPPPPNPSTKSLLPESTWEHILFSEKSQPFPSRSTRSSSGIETGTKLYVSDLIIRGSTWQGSFEDSVIAFIFSLCLFFF
ncbi:unnamed protein product [Brassica oleracea]